MHSATMITKGLHTTAIGDNKAAKISAVTLDVLEKKCSELGAINSERDVKYRVRDATYAAFVELKKCISEVKSDVKDAAQLANFICAMGKNAALHLHTEHQDDVNYLAESKQVMGVLFHPKIVDDKFAWMKDLLRDLFVFLSVTNAQVYAYVLKIIEKEVIELQEKLNKEQDETMMSADCKYSKGLNFKTQTIRNLFLCHAIFQEYLQQQNRRLSSKQQDVSAGFIAALIRLLSAECLQLETIWCYKNIIFTSTTSKRFVDSIAPTCAVLKKIASNIQKAADYLDEINNLHCFLSELKRGANCVFGAEGQLTEKLCSRLDKIFLQLNQLYAMQNPVASSQAHAMNKLL